MKIYLVLLLSCASVMGADTDIKVQSTIGSSGNFKLEVFTRDGQTNLVCDTRMKDGGLVSRTQTFYHDGSKLGYCITMPDVQDFVAEAGSPYSISYRARAKYDTDFVYVRAKDGSYVDIYTCTNGVYYPAERRLIAEMNEVEKQAIKQAHEAAMKQMKQAQARSRNK